MRILLLNPAHPSIGSRIPREHLPPLGLLSVGGPVLDAGHEVQLLDAEFGPLSVQQIADKATYFAPEAVLISHSGSTSGHPIVAETTRAIRRRLAKTWIIYGGVFPTYHWREILTDEPQINFIVRGEGEDTPHRWTSYYRMAADRKVIQTDIRKWDYKRQVLATQKVPPWRVLLWVKFIEAVLQLRPRSLWRLLAHSDRAIRGAMRWYYRVGRKVWFREIWNFLFQDHHQKNGPTLEEFWGEPQNEEQYAMERQAKKDDFICAVGQQLLKEKHRITREAAVKGLNLIEGRGAIEAGRADFPGVTVRKQPDSPKRRVGYERLDFVPNPRRQVFDRFGKGRQIFFPGISSSIR